MVVAVVRAAAAAYAPYSKFLVGAAVLLRDGRVIIGVNVENASYPLGMCAERCALSRAVAEGLRPGDIEAVAVTASPCGGCRQWLLEFGIERLELDPTWFPTVHEGPEICARISASGSAATGLPERGVQASDGERALADGQIGACE